MIFDHRTYNIKPNRLGKFLETYERLALPLQRKYLGEPYGFFVTHIGPHESGRPSVAIRKPGGSGTTSRRDGGRSGVAGLSAGCFGARHAGRHGKSDSKAGVVLRSALSDRRPVVRVRSMRETAVEQRFRTRGTRDGRRNRLRCRSTRITAWLVLASSLDDVRAWWFRRAWLVTRFGPALPRLSLIASMPRSGILPTP